MPRPRPAARAAPLCCGAALASASDARKGPTTIADIMRIRNVVDLPISPDGRAVASVISVLDVMGGRYNTDMRNVEWFGKWRLRRHRGKGRGPSSPAGAPHPPPPLDSVKPHQETRS